MANPIGLDETKMYRVYLVTTAPDPVTGEHEYYPIGWVLPKKDASPQAYSLLLAALVYACLYPS